MAWRPLKCSSLAAAYLPPLLISATFSNESYRVHLTDLTHIWTECLDRQSIIRRSKDEATSIDPSDNDQFHIFLEKVQLGLQGGKNTTLGLTINPGFDRPPLVLKMSIGLPGGLAPLEWSFQLSVAPATELTNVFILPLLESQSTHLQELQGLLEVLREKDHVIQKMLDTFESQGADLGDVFPQAAIKGVKKVDRIKAKDRIRGLEVFDLATWRNSLSLDVPQNSSRLIGQVFTERNAEVVPKSSQIMTDGPATWWADIKGVTVNLGTGKISTNGLLSKLGAAEEILSIAKRAPREIEDETEETDDGDDDFQVQTLPAHLSKSTRATAVNESETTDEDEDLDAPSQHSKPRDRSRVTPPAVSPYKSLHQRGKLGAKSATSKYTPKSSRTSKTPIDDDDGDRIEDLAPHEPLSTRTAPTQKDTAHDDYDESTESTEDEPPAPKARPTSKTVPSSVPKRILPNPTRQVGRIGRKNEPSTPALPRAAESDHNKADVEPYSSPSRVTAMGARITYSPVKPEVSGAIDVSRASPVQTETTSAIDTAKHNKEREKGRGKLGKIGGRKIKPISSEHEDEPEPGTNPDSDRAAQEPHEASPSHLAEHKKRKLGVIGGHSHKAHVPLEDDEVDVKAEAHDESQEHRGGVTLRPKHDHGVEEEEEEEEKVEKKRETSVERIERRKEEMKKELEEKARVPVKKKRRF